MASASLACGAASAAALVLPCCAGRGAARRVSVRAESVSDIAAALGELVEELEPLLTVVGDRSVHLDSMLRTSGLLTAVEAESDDALRLIGQLKEARWPWQRRRLAAALASRLGAALAAAACATQQAARGYGFSPSSAYWSAVEKVRGRTPYMSDWGDGTSTAASAPEAQQIWSQKKMEQKAQGDERYAADSVELASRALRGDEADARSQLLLTVHSLVSQGGCPWTASQTPYALLTFLKDECAEAREELDALAAEGGDVNFGYDGPSPAGGRSARSGKSLALRRALVSEMGDILFDIFMAILLAARDFDLQTTALLREAARVALDCGSPLLTGEGRAAYHAQGQQ